MPAAVGAFVLPSLAGTLTAGVVGGAIVGAAIGGISAAITGGDIGQGILFGAVGGAVTGAVSHGLSAVMNKMSVSSSQLGAVGAEQATIGGIPKAALDNQMAITTAKATGGVPTLVPEGVKVVHAGVEGSSFLTKLGESLGGGFAQAAVGEGIGAIADMYMANKAGERQQEQFDKELQYKYDQLASLEARASGGGGGGGSGPDYTIDELILRDRKAAEEERTTALARIDSELNAQKALKQQEYNEAGAARERMQAGARVVASGGSAGSRSTDTLVDIQDRIRAGEDAQGTPNTGVIPPVTYVPPEQVA